MAGLWALLDDAQNAQFALGLRDEIRHFLNAGEISGLSAHRPAPSPARWPRRGWDSLSAWPSPRRRRAPAGTFEVLLELGHLERGEEAPPHRTRGEHPRRFRRRNPAANEPNRVALRDGGETGTLRATASSTCALSTSQTSRAMPKSAQSLFAASFSSSLARVAHIPQPCARASSNLSHGHTAARSARPARSPS